MAEVTSTSQKARTNMVECQLRPNRVYNPGVLQAMLALPREDFVPASLKSVAYTDEALKIAAGRYILEPLVTARLFEVALIASHEHVMVVGSGTGYTAAIAAHVAADVVAVEEDEALIAAAGPLPANVTVKKGKLTEGCVQHAPYDVIIVDGGVATVPQALFDQLKPHGRLVTILRQPGAAPHIVIYERAGDAISHRIAYDNVAPILPGFEARQEFELA